MLWRSWRQNGNNETLRNNLITLGCFKNINVHIKGDFSYWRFAIKHPTMNKLKDTNPYSEENYKQGKKMWTNNAFRYMRYFDFVLIKLFKTIKNSLKICILWWNLSFPWLDYFLSRQHWLSAVRIHINSKEIMFSTCKCTSIVCPFTA